MKVWQLGRSSCNAVVRVVLCVTQQGAPRIPRVQPLLLLPPGTRGTGASHLRDSDVTCGGLVGGQATCFWIFTFTV